MNSLEKIKDIYETTIKGYYGFICKDVIVTREEEECFTELIFKHRMLQTTTSFSYGFSNDLYPENDRVSFDGDADVSYDCFCAIHNFIEAIHSHRFNETMMEIITNYFKKEVKNKND